MTAAASRRRLNEAITSLHRFASSRKLDAMHAERAGVDLNFAAYAVLGRVVEHGPLSLGALAKQAAMAPNALSRQVRLLEDAGHLARRADPEDGRIAVVEATAEGRDAHRRLREANEALLARQLRDWSPDELDDLAARMERLVADLRRLA
jgi:DNA-binding MarR family transcriptional regulator